MGLREIQEESQPRLRCTRCGAERETSIEEGLCSACGSEMAAPTTIELLDSDAVAAETAPAEDSSVGGRYKDLREKLAGILQDLRPGDVDHAPEIAESLTAGLWLSPAGMLVFLVMLLPAGWIATGLTNRLTIQHRVEQDAQRLAERIENYRGETGLYPDAATWQSWIHGADAVSFLDPWQKPYMYSVDSRAFTIATYGADGSSGGTLKDRDLTIVFPYVNPRMALPHAQSQASPSSP